MTSVSRRRLTLIFLIIGFGVVGLVLPFSGDNLMWGGQPGLDLLHRLFYDYNGRIISNTVIVAVTRVTPLRVLFYSVSSVALIYLITVMGFQTNKVTGWQLMASTGLLITMSQEVISQTFGWLSGFVNYVAGMVPLLFVVYWIKKKTDKKTSVLQIVAMTLIGLLSALIVEHITLYMVLLGVGGLYYAFKKNPLKRNAIIGFLTGTVIGAVMMFRDPSYFEALAGNNRERHLAFGQKIFNQLTETYTGKMYRYVFHQNFLIVALLTFGLIWLIWTSPKGNQFLKLCVSTLLGGYLFLVVFSSQIFNWSNLDGEGIFTKLLALSTLFYLLGIVLSIGLLKNSELKTRIWFYAVSALILSSPFAVITPYGPRCAFGSIVFLLIAALDVGREVLMESNGTHSALIVSSFLFGSLALFSMVAIMSLNGHYNQQRVSQMRRQANAGETTIVLKRLPFDQYNWDTCPTIYFGTGYWSLLKQAHLDPNHYKLVFIPFKN